MKSNYLSRVVVFKNIHVGRPSITRRRITTKITITSNGTQHAFNLIFSFHEDVDISENLAGIISVMPVINFAYFAEKVHLDFDTTSADLEHLKDFIHINNREVFIDAICRRRYEFFESDAIPSEDEITEVNANGITAITCTRVIAEPSLKPTLSATKVAVLSSGGKESLLTQSIMNECGFDVFPVFINEAGAHWRAAKPAFDELSRLNPNTSRVWTNVDRFYRFCMRLLPFVRRSMIMKKSDTFPVQLFTFGVYIFGMLPLLLKHGIQVALMGNEFDDPLEMHPFNGLKHYYAIYDQTPDFTMAVTRYLQHKGINMQATSLLYPVSATIVERILIERYPDIFLLQRSCHSCRSRNGQILPCGVCSKCMGVIMLILAAGGKPELIGYGKEHIVAAQKSRDSLRFDPEEIDFLYSDGKNQTHVTALHILPGEKSPFSYLPDGIAGCASRILGQYARPVYSIRDGSWRQVKNMNSQ